MQRQKKFLNNMKVFHDLRNMTFQSEIGKRKSTFNKIEYTSLNLRNDAEEIHQSLLKIKEKISETRNSIALVDKKNKSIENDYKIFLRDFLKIQIRLLYLNKNLGVKSVEEIILRFNQERLNYQNYYLQVVEINKSIASLNIRHSQFMKKLESMNSKISQKNLEKNFINFEVLKSFTNELHLENKDSTNTHSELIGIEEANFNSKEKIRQIEIFLLTICKFLEFYEKKVSEEIKHFRKILMLESDTNPSVDNLNLNNSKRSMLLKSISIELNEKNANLKKFFSLDDTLKFDPYAIKKFLKFFFDFENKFLYLVSIVSANVGLDIYSSNLGKKLIETKEKDPQSNENREDNQKIIFIFNENILNSLEGMKSLAMTKIENKYKIINRTDNEIFKRFKLEKKSK